MSVPTTVTEGTVCALGGSRLSTITPLSSPVVTLTVEMLREAGPATTSTVSMLSGESGTTV